jgi:hypothetical protein
MMKVTAGLKSLKDFGSLHVTVFSFSGSDPDSSGVRARACALRFS